MYRVGIANTNLRCSKFVFGTASLFNAGRQSERIRLLREAAFRGFTHFDTAPYYGFGTAERDLGELLKSHPELTVTTKVGIYSPGGEDQLAVAVFLRKGLGKLVRHLAQPTVDFAVSRAKLALEGSLRRLGRDHIDIYLLHEPETRWVRLDEWKRWLEDSVVSGKIGSYGIAGTADRIADFFSHDDRSIVNVVQMIDSLDQQEADILKAYGHPLQFTYGYVSAARARGVAASVPDVLREAALRNPTGAVLVSTVRTERVMQYANIMSDLH